MDRLSRIRLDQNRLDAFNRLDTLYIRWIRQVGWIERERQRDRKRERETDGQMDGWMDWMDRWMDGWIDRQIDRSIDSDRFRQIHRSQFSETKPPFTEADCLRSIL